MSNPEGIAIGRKLIPRRRLLLGGAALVTAGVAGWRIFDRLEQTETFPEFITEFEESVEIVARKRWQDHELVLYRGEDQLPFRQHFLESGDNKLSYNALNQTETLFYVDNLRNSIRPSPIARYIGPLTTVEEELAFAKFADQSTLVGLLSHAQEHHFQNRSADAGVEHEIRTFYAELAFSPSASGSLGLILWLERRLSPAGLANSHVPETLDHFQQYNDADIRTEIIPERVLRRNGQRGLEDIFQSSLGVPYTVPLKLEGLGISYWGTR